jgi:flagellin
MTIINTNVKALFAHQSLKVNDRMMTDAMQQLSTGKRINSAKDDAAGLAIGTRMTADLRGLAVAIRNANDGISMMQTAEGALGEISNMLQRMRELAVQSANGTMSRSNREALQAEMDQLLEEVDNVAKTTNFNGIRLLDGTSDPVLLQTGVREGEQVQVKIVDARTRSLGLQGFAIEGEVTSGRVGSVSAIVAEDDVLINGKPAFAAGSLPADNSAKSLASSVNTNVGQHNVKVAAFNTLRGTTPTALVFATGDLQINGVSVSAASSVDELVSNINRDVGGVTAVLSPDGRVELSNNDGRDIVVDTNSTAGFTAGTYAGYITMESLDGVDIELYARSDGNGYPGGTGTVADLQKMGLNETQDGTSFSGVSVSTSAISVSDDIRINGVRIGTSLDSSAIAKASTINAVTEQTGIKASAVTEVAVTVNMNKVATAGLVINGASVATSTVQTMAQLTTAINSAGISGIIASTNEAGTLILRSSSGADITINDTTVAPGDRFVTDAVSLSGDAALGALGVAATDGLTIKGRITLSSDVGAEIRVESESSASLAKLGLAAQGGTDVLVGGALTIVTQEAAGRALTTIDKAIDQILINRATLGAFQNRMTVAVDSLMTTSTALNQARSRIMDADYAQASTELARNQIIQQAGTAILAQANTSQQAVLQLIQG